ncbi:DUF3817 domain-containing protein [Psychrobium sp. 1_MG-2023]|uniref:DUF3817 domain-containing protein n=1 Tax=Psychrobium sp. 1_MG-2023 TaxID=3062624 RepID=UPI000C34DC44|nr:DUF3817 domain-containing protein [Psychrobium sp. 1_MG-2023]MDP2562651.1 DUF3817 domain-containing protein [Psychrobium sp. 1_MG-2023]PKF53820.1 DUF3817 domain-containing protein [Alteromonadales bacterium alter-6D02]
MLTLFRAVSLLEGLSYIAILSITMGFVSREFVSQVGMAHGILFMMYVFLSMQVCNKQRWSGKVSTLLFLASLVPFAFIPVELFVKKAINNPQQASS